MIVNEKFKMKNSKLTIFNRQRRGISLYELLIVMAIIGILAAVTIPLMKDYLPSWQLSGSARVVLSKLRQAQEEAVATQKQHALRFSPTDNPVTYQLIKIEATETVLETITMPNNITVTGTGGAPLNATFSNNQVKFSADGGPSANGDIVITLGEASKTINISPAGVMKIQS